MTHGMSMLVNAAELVWRETFRQPGGGRCDLLRLAREMRPGVSRTRFKSAEVEFETYFGAMTCVPYGDGHEQSAWKRRM